MKSFNKLLQQSLLWRGFYFITVLLLNIAISHVLHADGSGWLFFCTNIFNLLLLLASLNLESGFAYFASSNKIAHNSLAMLGILWSVFITAILVPALYFYSKSTANSFTTLSSLRFTYYAATFIIGIMLTAYFTVLFYSNKNFFIPNIYLAFSNLCLLLVVILQTYLQYRNNSILTVYFLFYPIQGIGLAVLFFARNHSREPFRLPSMADLRLLLRYSLITLAGNVAFYLLYRVDYFFVNKYCSDSELGNYIQASKLGQMLLIIPQILASAIFPQIASGQFSEQVGDSILILFRLFIQVFAFLFILIALTCKWLFPFAFGSSFQHVYLPMLIIIPGIFCLSVLALLASYFAGKGRIRLNVTGTCLGVLVAIIGDILLVPKLGINGAAIVSSIAYASFLIYGIWHFKKLHPFNIKELVTLSKADWLWVGRVLLNK